MKIKELHLRNIASIETADIDFTKDLADGVTGDPASIFLICGDTGAGKSVILDGISMALYKTTPRLSGTSNKNNNTFSESTGEKISISSIDQYTRLGISDKEDSYSELTFIGNDDKGYTARLTLGMYLGNTDKSTGKRHLKHRKPSWTLETDGKTLTKDADIEEVIKQAVGLTFEQFGRMAMLAQGQFASFLTGDKKERESILEQLTNTEHFTAFGNAIKSLFDKASGEYKTADAILKAESEHSVAPEELAKLIESKTEAEKTKKELDKKIKSNQDTIEQVKLIDAARKALADAQRENAELEEYMNSEEYKDAVNLTAGWMATIDQRQKLTNMRKAAQERGKAVDEENLLRETFSKLTADLCLKKEDSAKKEEAISKQQAWIDQRKDKDTLYSEASAAALKIGNYIKTTNEIAQNKQKAQEEKEKTEELQKKSQEAQKTALEAADAVNAKQKEIDALTTARQALNPDKVNKDLSNANDRKNLITNIKKAVSEIETTAKNIDQQQKQISQDQAALAQLEKDKDQAKAAYDNAATLYEGAKNILSTMEMSLDDKIVALREKLIKEKADTCPLCGQHITEISIESDFDDILTPLKNAQQQAKETHDNARKAFDDASGKYNSALGALNVQTKSYNTAVAELNKKKEALNADATKAELDTTQELNSQIADALNSLETQIEALKKQQQDAINIQNSIDKLINDKKPLDKAKSAADKKETAAKKAVDDNNAEIKRLAETAQQLTAQLKENSDEVNSTTGSAYPDWADDPASTRDQLKKDAEEYNKAKKTLADDKTAFDKQKNDIKNIDGHCIAIKEKHGEWNISTDPLPYPSNNILGAWRKLLSDVQATATKIEGHDATINDCAKALISYYEESGKSEKDLDAIDARSGEIDSLQNMIKQTEAKVKSRTDAITTAQRQIAESKAKLQIEKDEDLPAIEALEETDKMLSAERDQVVALHSSIVTRLEANDKNKETIEKAKAHLEEKQKTLDKWNILNNLFGGTRLRTLVQTYILKPLLNNANIYLEKITDRYTLTCSKDNEQLSILVEDRYNKNQVRSATVLSGGEKFMISLALSLALSSLNRPDMNVDILFIDEGFGTLDEKSLDSVMQTLERLQEIAGESQRRVGIISHREELDERIPVQIQVIKKGEGRSVVKTSTYKA